MPYSTLVFVVLTWITRITSANNLNILENGSNTNSPSSSENKESWTTFPLMNDDIKLGQISGVAIDINENIYLFHRGGRVWNAQSFNIDNVFQENDAGPIKEPTILVLNKNGTLLHQWGNGMFYMPHGITVDSKLNIWVTDVALHQIMKISPPNSTTMLLGVKFTPGRDSTHFCKPTSVAVVSNGDFFVADGYCNSRILKFNSEGVKILEWGRSTVSPEYRIPDPGEFRIPHVLTLAEDKGLVCVADRENGRVQCFNISNGNFSLMMSSKSIGHRIFSVAYTSAEGGLFFLVNGNNFGEAIPVQVFKLSANGNIIKTFGQELTTPHDIAVSSDGGTVYVVEIDPFKAWKFVLNPNKLAKLLPDVKLKTVLNVARKEEYEGKKNSYHINEETAERGLTGALMVTGACLIFSAAIVVSAFKYSRSRESGCRRCGRNGWPNNGSHDVFNLGNILNNQGFIKLKTGEESDEDQPLA